MAGMKIVQIDTNVFIEAGAQLGDNPSFGHGTFYKAPDYDAVFADQRRKLLERRIPERQITVLGRDWKHCQEILEQFDAENPDLVAGDSWMD